MEALRNQEAASKLEEIKAFHRQYPLNRIGYRERLDAFLASFGNTSAGKEAQGLLNEAPSPDLSAVRPPETGVVEPLDANEPLAEEFAWAEAIDLLTLIDVKRDRVNGDWRMGGGRLVVQPAANARIRIPYRPPAEYDFRVTFVRSEGDEDVNQFLTNGSAHFFWSMGCQHNTGFGFDLVDGREAYFGRTAVHVPLALENGKEHVAVVQVRKASLKAWLNGKVILFFPTNYKALSMRKDWALNRTGVLGLGAHLSQVTFTRAQLREVTGKGERLK